MITRDLLIVITLSSIYKLQTLYRDVLTISHYLINCRYWRACPLGDEIVIGRGWAAMIGDCNVGGSATAKTSSMCDLWLSVSVTVSMICLGFLIRIYLWISDGVFYSCYCFSTSSVMSKSVVIIFLTDHLNIKPYRSYIFFKSKKLC